MLLCSFKRLIIISIFLTIFLNTNEIFANLISANIRPDFISYEATPIYIKLLKDMFLVLFSIMAFFIQTRRMSPILILLLPIFSYFFLECCLTYLENDILYVVSGLRWALPFFLPMLFMSLFDAKFLKKFTNILMYVFLISFLFQIYESFSKYNIYGFNSYNLPSRLPGIFYIPHTAGAFNCITFCYVFFRQKSSKVKLIFLPLILISTLLTNSGTAIATLFIIILSLIITYWKDDSHNSLRFQIYKLILPVVLFFVLSFLPEITQRATINSQSGLSRVSYLLSLINQSEIISSKFGKFTNTLAMFEIYYHENAGFIIMDSTVGNILGNLGMLALFVFIFILIIWLIVIFLSSNVEFFCFSISTIFFCMTSSINESYPLNLLLAISFSYLIPKVYKEMKRKQILNKLCSPSIYSTKFGKK